jgi:O-antigen/teichoic acid export membrane protein
MRRDRSFVANVTGTFLTRIVLFVLGLVSSIITARVLGPHDRGIFSLLIVLPATVATVLKLGLAQANIYYVRKEREDASAVASHSLLVALIMGGAVILAIALAQDALLTSVLRGVDGLLLLIVLPLVPLLLVESYLFGVLQALGRFDLFNRRQQVSALSGLGAMVVALVVWKAGLLGAVVASAVVTVAMNLWLIVTVHRICPLRPRLELRLVRRLLGFGLKSHVQTLATHLHFRLDLYLVAYFLGPSDVAFYAIATRLAELLLFVPDAIGLVLYPRLAGAHQNERAALAARATRHTVFAAVAGGAGLFLLGPWLITIWYGAAYSPAGRPLLFLLLGLVAMAVYYILTRYFTSQNRQQVNIAASAIALAVNVSLNLLLIPALGVAGAGLSTTVSYTLSTLMLLVAFRRETGQRLSDILLLRPPELAVYTRLGGQRRRRLAPEALD